VKNHTLVALVTVTEVQEPQWNTPDGAASEVSPEDAGARFIYTPVDVKVDSYIKGSGPEALRLAKIGGTRDCVAFEVSDEKWEFTTGMRAVVFLTPPGINVDGWTLGNAYIIEANTAYSTIDQREIQVEALLPQLEPAAAAEGNQ
jgi:hypothetical protein